MCQKGKGTASGRQSVDEFHQSDAQKMSSIAEVDVQYLRNRGQYETYLATTVVLQAEPHEVKVVVSFGRFSGGSGRIRGHSLARLVLGLDHTSRSLLWCHGIGDSLVCSEVAMVRRWSVMIRSG